MATGRQQELQQSGIRFEVRNLLEVNAQSEVEPRIDTYGNRQGLLQRNGTAPHHPHDPHDRRWPLSTDESITGQRLAMLFAQQAASSLDASQLRQLVQFFYGMPRINTREGEAKAENKLRKVLDNFYKLETETSGLESDYLSQPSGSVSAEIGIILYCPTGTGYAGPFWDETSCTVQILQMKGFDPSFCFCYDWHWRKEKSHLSRGACPTASWKKNLKKFIMIILLGFLILYRLDFFLLVEHAPNSNIRIIQI